MCQPCAGRGQWGNEQLSPTAVVNALVSICSSRVAFLLLLEGEGKRQSLQCYCPNRCDFKVCELETPHSAFTCLHALRTQPHGTRASKPGEASREDQTHLTHQPERESHLDQHVTQEVSRVKIFDVRRIMQGCP